MLFFLVVALTVQPKTMDRETLRINGIAIIFSSVNQNFIVLANRVISRTSQNYEEDKKNLAEMFIKAMDNFSQEAFDRWLDNVEPF